MWGGGMDAVTGAVFLGAAILFVLSFLHFKESVVTERSNSKIPNGFNGWPFIGETLDFANADPLKFATPRVKKYGPVFKSHLVGVPSIVVTSPDMARFIYSERSLFRASYPSTIATLVGKKSLSNCEPKRHPFLKKLVHSALLPESLKDQVVHLEEYAVDLLNSWDGRTIQTAAEMKEFTLTTAVYFIFGIPSRRGSDDVKILVKAYRALLDAFYAIPINLPGSTWYKALEQRKLACEYLSKQIALSRKNAEEGKPCNSVLRALVVAKDENGKKLEDDEIIDVLIGTLFGAHDTTATSLTWIIKRLTENPDILKAVTAEQDELLKSKEPGSPLTWENTRNMPYTMQVIHETLRNPTILQFTARAATEDVEYKGILIPKGWRVFVMTTCIHLDPANFPEPKTFDPSRFKVAPKPGTYLPFAGGTHICPGNELGKLNMLVFIHHLTTKFRWESVHPDIGTEFKPFPSPKGGYPIQVCRRP